MKLSPENMVPSGQGYRPESERECFGLRRRGCHLPPRGRRPAMNRRSRFLWSVRKRASYGHSWRRIFAHEWWGI